MNDQVVQDILTKPTKLSQDQGSAVVTKSRFSRIIAGAGAGKTETLTRRIAYLLLVKGVQPSSIVAFTFTEKASLSMKNRIYERVGQIGGEKATANLGEMHIGTIHGYAKRILEDHFGLGNYNVFDENQEMAYLLREGWNLGLNSDGGSYAKNCANFLRAVNMVWGEMINEKLLKKKASDFYNKMKSYEDLLETNKRLTFGKMIHTLVLRLRESKEPLSGVKYLIVDEYQDINRAQAELIELIGKNSEVFVVGDPRQSIYQWRGSDERFFQEFSSTFPTPMELSIKENRRSLESIVNLANEFADSFNKKKYVHLEAVRKEKGFVGLVEHEDAGGEAEWIADQIKTFKSNGLKYSDVGILLRSVNTSAPPFLEVFREKKIPFIVGGKVGLFKRGEAQAIGRIFSWLCDDGFWVENPWKWGEQTRGDDLLSTGMQLWKQSHSHEIPPHAIDKLKKMKENLQNTHSKCKNFTQIFHYILNSLGFLNLEPDDPNDATVMANLGRFNTLLTDYETANRIGGRTPHWSKDLKGLCWFMNSYASLSYEEQPSDDIRGINAVQIMTVHQAKGLEWHVVFLPALVKQRFPSSMVGKKQNWCGIPRDIFDVKRYEGDEEDERRLFYVAVTRAKDVLVMSYFRKYKNTESISPFVSEIDGSLFTKIKEGQELPKLQVNAASNNSEMQSFSAGEIIDYERCPQMYRLGKIWGYQPGLDVAIGFGNSIHFCLRRAAELVKKEGFSPLSAVTTSVDEEFHVPFAGGEVFDNLKEGAKRLLSEFSKKYGDDLRRIEEVEYRLEFPIHNATIMGKVDVILKNDKEMEVRDYKTSDKGLTFDEASVQVQLYTIGLRKMGRLVTSGSIAYLEKSDWEKPDFKKPSVEPVDVQEKRLDETRKRAESSVTGIMNRRFNPKAGENCSRCDHCEICKWRNK